MRLRLATEADLPALRALMDRAIGGLQSAFLTPAQVEASREIMGLDTRLVLDGTYFVAEDAAGVPLGCGGWSRRRTLFGGDHSAGRSDDLLEPETEPARVRAMYVDPGAARRGVGRAVLDACEAAAAAEGFRRGELVATLAGEPLYRAGGWAEIERFAVATSGGVEVPVLRMGKALSDARTIR